MLPSTALRDAPDLGTLIRDWRARRRRSQMDVALAVGVSPRHLSFIETGRSRPSAPMLLALAQELDVPLRERNRLLMAAGHAPWLGRHGRWFNRLDGTCFIAIGTVLTRASR